MSYYHLAHRCLIALSGEAPIAFLQDILTADIASLSDNEMRQSCLLSPQGRILVEMCVYVASPTDDEAVVYIACDASQQDELIKKLQLYRLRRKITITDAEDLCLIACDDNAPEMLSPQMLSPEMTPIICARDERAPHRGYQIILPKDALAQLLLADDGLYKANRIRDAIPEGPDELQPNRALMLEAGLDVFAAVDFKKGCYIGQEVTARTHYRGLVKRRLVPVRATHLSSDAPLMQDDKDVGQMLTTVTDGTTMIGLASLRLTAIHLAESGTPIYQDGTQLTLEIPDHLRPLPKPDSK